MLAPDSRPTPYAMTVDSVTTARPVRPWSRQWRRNRPRASAKPRNKDSMPLPAARNIENQKRSLRSVVAVDRQGPMPHKGSARTCAATISDAAAAPAATVVPPGSDHGRFRRNVIGAQRGSTECRTRDQPDGGLHDSGTLQHTVPHPTRQKRACPREMPCPQLADSQALKRSVNSAS